MQDIETEDFHTAGEPYRIVTSGVPSPTGVMVLDRREWAEQNLDDVRALLVNEPRGHADMYGCFVTPPDPDDHLGAGAFGMVFFHKDGFSTACGHGTIAGSTWAISTGLVPAVAPVTRLNVDVPSGRLQVEADVSYVDGQPHVGQVRFENVPSFVTASGLEVHAAGRSLSVDVSYGGAFYASADVAQLGVDITAANLGHPLETSRRCEPLSADARIGPVTTDSFSTLPTPSALAFNSAELTELIDWTKPRMTLPNIDADTLNELVSMADAIDALRQAFMLPMHHVERMAMEIGAADLLVMPAAHGQFAGVKSIVVQPANTGTGRPVIGGSYVLLDTGEARALATFDGAALTRLRTPAISAIAADLLADADATSAAVIGTGPQGVGHVEALQVVRPAMTTTLIGRNRSSADGAALLNANMVVTCTSSATPVIEAQQIKPDALVIAVGSYRPERAELAPDVLTGAEVWVDDRAACKTEAGDLHLAAQHGWCWDEICGDLHDLVGQGPCPPRQSGTARAVFKSVGLAVEDLVIAVLA